MPHVFNSILQMILTFARFILLYLLPYLLFILFVTIKTCYISLHLL